MNSIPDEVVAAAMTLRHYFERKGIEVWQVAGVASPGLVASLLAELERLKWRVFADEKPAEDDADGGGEVEFIWHGNPSNGCFMRWDSSRGELALRTVRHPGGIMPSHWRPIIRPPKP